MLLAVGDRVSDLTMEDPESFNLEVNVMRPGYQQREDTRGSWEDECKLWTVTVGQNGTKRVTDKAQEAIQLAQKLQEEVGAVDSWDALEAKLRSFRRDAAEIETITAINADIAKPEEL